MDYTNKMELSTQIIWCLATVVLLLGKPTSGCDRDGFVGQVRIDRIKKAEIVLYGKIQTNYAIVPPENSWSLHFFLKFINYCIVRNLIVDPDLTELLAKKDLVIKEIYHHQNCTKEWHLLNDNVGEMALLTLEYDSIANQLILKQINEESGIHIVSQNDYLVEQIDNLAKETENLDEKRMRFTSLSSYECSSPDTTSKPLSVAAVTGGSKPVKPRGGFCAVLVMFLWILTTN